MPSRILSLVVALIVAACAAPLGSPAVESGPSQSALDSPTADPVGVEVDARSTCKPYCSVHELTCEEGLVPVVYGLTLPLDKRRSELLRQNPNTHFSENPGCVVGAARVARILFCPACRDALSAYDRTATPEPSALFRPPSEEEWQAVLRLRQASLNPPDRHVPMNIPEHEIYYLEVVAADPQAARDFYQAAFGWQFTEATPELGGAFVADLPNGSLCAIRGSLSPSEEPTVRTYVRVLDVRAAVEKAVDLGATLALEPTEILDRGTIAIFLISGIEQGLWQLP